MTQTVDDLRNEIQEAVGRHRRIESTGFTKEALAAICEAVGYNIDTTYLLSKPQMRAGILWRLGLRDKNDPADSKRPFRKAELESIVTALQDN